jgi:hypothetical protein
LNEYGIPDELVFPIAFQLAVARMDIRDLHHATFIGSNLSDFATRQNYPEPDIRHWVSLLILQLKFNPVEFGVLRILLREWTFLRRISNIAWHGD